MESETQNKTIYNSVTVRGIRWLLLFVFFLKFLVPTLLEMKWESFFGTPFPDYISILSIQILAVAIPGVVFLYLSTANFKETLKLKPLNFGRGLMCFLIGLTAQSLASVLNVPMLMYVAAKHGELPALAMGTPQTYGELLWGIVFIAFIPAIFEELLMRGIVLSGTQPKGYRASLIIGGLYFALLHNQYENIAGHFFLGFLLCYIVWMTESVYGGIIAHFAFNLSGMLHSFWVNAVADSMPWAASERFHIIITVVSVLLFFLFLGTINRKRVKRNRSAMLWWQIIRAVLNLPVIIIILGYLLFQAVKYI